LNRPRGWLNAQIVRFFRLQEKNTVFSCEKNRGGRSPGKIEEKRELDGNLFKLLKRRKPKRKKKKAAPPKERANPADKNRKKEGAISW